MTAIDPHRAAELEQPAARARAERPPTRLVSRDFLSFFERTGLIWLSIGVALFFSLHPETNRTFPSATNLNNILIGQVEVSILAFAFMVPLVAGTFDLSIGANLALCSIVAASAMSHFHWPATLAVAAGVLAGGGVGAINAIAVVRLKLNSFIVTLGTATLISGIVQWYTNGETISSNISQEFLDFGSGKWLGVSQLAWVLFFAAGLVWYLLEHTPYGRYSHAIGSNPRAARLVGIPVDRISAWNFVVGGLLAGLAGVVAVAVLGSGNPQEGPNLLFPAVTGIFLSATCIRPGQYNVLGTLVGVFFVAVSVSGLTLMGVKPWVQPVFNGCALLFAVAISTALARRRRSETL